MKEKEKHDPEVVEHKARGLAHYIRLECKKCGKTASGQGVGYLLAHFDAMQRMDGFVCEKKDKKASKR